MNLNRVREFGWCAYCSSIEHMPAGGWFAISGAHGLFFEHWRSAARWVLRTSWIDAAETIKTRRSLRSGGYL